jgi:hypothetical protein
MTEQEIERHQVEYVFGLTGGELNNNPWQGEGFNFAYTYDGVPEWAQEDFSRDERFNETFVTVVLAGSYWSPSETLTDSQGTWKLVKTYAHSGECECPLKDCDVEDLALAGIVQKERCFLCEEEPGEQHGFIYLGDSQEAVYQLWNPAPDTHTWEVMLDRLGRALNIHECTDNACDIAKSIEGGLFLWAARLLIDATECEEVEEIFARLNPAQAHLEAERKELLTHSHVKCPGCGVLVWTEWDDTCSNCAGEIKVPVEEEG